LDLYEEPITKAEYAQRRLSLQRLLEEKRLHAILLSNLINIRYYTGFTGSNAFLLVTPKSTRLFTDPRYTVQAREQCDCVVEIGKSNLPGLLAARVEKLAAQVKPLKKLRLGFENTRVPYATFQEFQKMGQLLPLGSAAELARMVKSPAEVTAIRNSVNLNSQAFAKAMKRFKPGMSERDLAAEIDFQMRKLGASGTAFDTIVASGAHSALPHAQPRNEAIAPGGYLLIDMGACLDGYMSDMTRTMGVGKVPNEAKRIYEAVLESNLEAIAAIRPGVIAGEIHATATRALRRHKLDKFFVHSTGHGLGLEIHERPSLRAADETPLAEGMLITVEPGVYQEGIGGVRIEDTVLVTANGAEVLTPTPKSWTMVG
jgi:Xaa-Pro aminopeptidase